MRAPTFSPPPRPAFRPTSSSSSSYHPALTHPIVSPWISRCLLRESPAGRLSLLCLISPRLPTAPTLIQRWADYDPTPPLDLLGSLALPPSDDLPSKRARNPPPPPPPPLPPAQRIKRKRAVEPADDERTSKLLRAGDDLNKAPSSVGPDGKTESKVSQSVGCLSLICLRVRRRTDMLEGVSIERTCREIGTGGGERRDGQASEGSSLSSCLSLSLLIGPSHTPC
jgi:hypothetical protein